MTDAQQYAAEIRRQLFWAKHGAMPIAWSWGIPANSWMCGDGKLELSLGLNDETFTRETRAWLRFNVNGRLHKGLVYVILTGSDDYTIVLVKMKRKKVEGLSVTTPYAELVSETEGIYCDELARVVDGLVETPKKIASEA